MAGPKVVAFRGIQDCKIAKLLTDTDSETTYNTILDVPIKNLSFKPIIETYTLKHDDNDQEIDQVLQGYEITGAMARVPLDVLAVMEGGEVAATGTGDAEIQTYTNLYTDIPNYFKLETQSTRVFGSDGTPGDLHNLFHKCKITDMNHSIEDDFATIEFTARVVRTVYEGKLKTTIINETAAGIS